MAQVLVVTSGKGGVGKTTSTAALGAALAHDGAKVVVIDFDVGLRNLDLVLGAERRVVFDLINVSRVRRSFRKRSFATNVWRLTLLPRQTTAR
jgi:septum site-determining protein MinD